MALAWATVAVLIILLPGFLFFIGLSLPERFTRETVISPLGQLAGTVGISFLVHALLYVASYGSGLVPYPRIGYVLGLLQLQGADKITLQELAENIHAFRGSIFLYVVTSGMMGVGSGWLFGASMRWKPFRRFGRHRWVFDIAIEKSQSQTIAYVLTNVRHNDLVLMYSGLVKDFGLQSDGRFSYLVLKACSRGYLGLREYETTTTVEEDWHKIGEKSAEKKPIDSYLVIDGGQISNVVFDTILKEIVVTDVGAQAFQEALRKRQEALASGPASPLPAPGQPGAGGGTIATPEPAKADRGTVSTRRS